MAKSTRLSRLLSFEHQFVQYGAYHANNVNQWIHIFFVPLLLATLFVWLSGIPLQTSALGIRLSALSFEYPAVVQKALSSPLALQIWEKVKIYFPCDWATLVAFSYASYYIVLEPLSGLLAAPFLLGLNYGAHVFAGLETGYNMNYVALGLHLAAWTGQIVGHYAFEGRSPAFLDNAFQGMHFKTYETAVALAPLFVFVEALFKLGYRPKLQSKLNAQINKAILTWKKTPKRSTPRRKKD